MGSFSKILLSFIFLSGAVLATSTQAASIKVTPQNRHLFRALIRGYVCFEGSQLGLSNQPGRIIRKDNGSRIFRAIALAKTSQYRRLVRQEHALLRAQAHTSRPSLKQKIAGKISQIEYALKKLRDSFDSCLDSSSPINSDQPVLVPGAGFSGLTDTPAALGQPTDPGYDAQSIARWDVIPYQTFDAPLNIGVVAFHMNSIDRVEFSVNGGPWAAVSEMTLNPQSNVQEYWATLDPSKVPTDGLLEVRAIAYPKVGLPRVLQGPLTESYIDAGGISRTRLRDDSSLILFSNAKHTLHSDTRYVSPSGSDTLGNGSQAQPLATIEEALRRVRYADQTGNDKVAGATIYLEKGNYTFYFPGYQVQTSDAAEHNKQYITIAAAPGVSRDNVVIGQGYRGAYSANLHLKGLKVDLSDCSGLEDCHPLAGKGGVLWLDNVWVEGQGMAVGHLTTGGWATVYWSDCTVNNTQVAVGGALARHVLVTNAGEDAFKFTDVIIDSTVRNITDARPESYHPDVWQYFGGQEVMGNLVIYGLDAQQVLAQGLGAPACDDCAFVNMYINTTQVDPESVLQNLQLAGPHDHTLIKNTCLIGPNNLRTDFGFTAHNVAFEHSYMANVRGQLNGINPDIQYRFPAGSCAEALEGYIEDFGPPALKVAAPAISPAAGTYPAPLEVTLSVETPGAEIRYTLDGTNPQRTSTLYTGPLAFSTNTRIKAKAFKYGMLSGDAVLVSFSVNSAP